MPAKNLTVNIEYLVILPRKTTGYTEAYCSPQDRLTVYVEPPTLRRDSKMLETLRRDIGRREAWYLRLLRLPA